MRKILIIIALILMLAIALFELLQKPPIPNPAASAAQQILPWQIELVDGHSRVFGLMPGKSRMADVVEKIGTDYELAIIAKPGQAETLELYTSNFKAGALRGSLIAIADVQTEDITQLRQLQGLQKEFLETGSSKTTLRFEQQQAALTYPLKSLLFFPVAKLEKGLLEERFGLPALVLQTAEKITHYLYPQLGVDIMIDEKGKDYLQYVSPADFAVLQYALEYQAQSHSAATD